MKLVVDAHTLLWFVDDSPKLSSKAKKALTESREIGSLVIPIIVLFESLTVLEKANRIGEFTELLRKVVDNPVFTIPPIDISLLKICAMITKEYELHDRMIVAVAIIFNAPIVTKDSTINRLYKKTIW